MGVDGDETEGMTMVRELLVCVICGDERDFEQPPCADGHRDDCPDLVCVECGWAISWVVPAADEAPVELRQAG